MEANQDASAGISRFADLSLRGDYDSTEDLLGSFYVPVLQRAITYDRVAGYFFSSSFVSAAAGLAKFISNQGTIRLLVGAQLTDADREALLGESNLDEILTQRLLEGVDLTADEVARRRYEVIAWLVRKGRLQIRVGVPCDDDGVPLPAGPELDKYFHTKWGALTDAAGDRIVFHGTVNESAQGWERNFETFSVFPSWKAQIWNEYGQKRVELFERLWQGGEVAGWKTVSLPTAVEEHLIELIPNDADWVPEPFDPLEDPIEDPVPPISLTKEDLEVIDQIRVAPHSGTGVGVVSTGITPWPHQVAIARRVIDTWPRSYLLADEVGLGKTIEAGLILRELLLSGVIETALILVPASVMKQWQEELVEKFLLDIPRLESGRLRWANEQTQVIPASADPWRMAPVLIASSHLARRRERQAELVDGRPWDLVLLDETHHAGRKGSRPNDPPNQMLTTLLALKNEGMCKAFLLASATPMQLHTHDLWNLLDLLGLNGRWAENAQPLESYFKELREPFNSRQWQFLRRMVADHLAVTEPEPRTQKAIEDQLGWVAADRIFNFHQTGMSQANIAEIPGEERPYWDDWLRANTPVRDRVFRTTRATLRHYRETALLPADTIIPERHVHDEFLSLGSAQSLYNRIEDYIRRHYDAFLAAGGKSVPLGFIMTIYRRRLTSSFYAIRRSLERRRDGLANRKQLVDLLDEDDLFSLESTAELEDFIRELTDQPPDEPKMARLHELLNEAFTGGHKTVVIFTQYTDTLTYVRSQLLQWFDTQIICYFGGGGERWNPVTETWDRLSKEAVKDLFRRGEEVRILLGTDSLSEGLNLQTCDRLINFDLPWNFMRVEQRIGRIDRIGGLPHVKVTNLFYEGTVEEDIYQRIKERHDWFTHVVGNAQPVLAATESVIQQAAMGKITREDAAGKLNEAIDQLEGAHVKLEDLDAVPQFEYPLEPVMTLENLQDALLGIEAVKARLYDHPDLENAWLLEVGAAKHEVTFDSTTYEANVGLELLSWGNPLLEKLLDEISAQPMANLD